MSFLNTKFYISILFKYINLDNKKLYLKKNQLYLIDNR